MVAFISLNVDCESIYLPNCLVFRNTEGYNYSPCCILLKIVYFMHVHVVNIPHVHVVNIPHIV